MPLAKPLPDLRRQLQEILTEDLAAALNALKEVLPEGSEKHKQALALRARLNDANKERFRNTLSPDEYQRRVDTIRAACFDLIGDLEEGDFEAPAPEKEAASAKASAAKHGSVLYRVPHRMPLRKPTICTVRVAIDEEAILEDIVLDDDVRLRQRVEVSDMMRAELLDPEGDVFSIRQLSEPEQLVRETGYTQWLFSATPRVEGEHQLLVKVSMMEYNANLGKYVPREVSILETITIVTETAVSDSEEAPMKATGERFTLGPDMAAFQGPPTRPVRPQRPARPFAVPRSMRTIALFFIFLLIATSTTWAFTPQGRETISFGWAYWVEDTPEAYEKFLEKYPNSRFRAKALSRKAELTDDVFDYQQYLEENPQGEDAPKAMQAIERLGNKAIEEFQRAPGEPLMLDISTKFPDKLERLRDIMSSMETFPALKQELLPAIEQQIKRRDSLATIKTESNPNLSLSQNSISETPKTPLSQTFPGTSQTSGTSTSKPGQPASNPTAEPEIPKEVPLPDTDGDGVPDKADQCPNEKGDAANNGCPTLEPPRERKSGLTMVSVQGGTFTMGCLEGRDKDCDDSEKPAHTVTLSGFQIGKYEVTQADWRDVMGNNPSFKNCDECPVENVSWDEVQVFLKKLNAKTGKKYRLPTEAEWEYAARGGHKMPRDISMMTAYAGSNDIGKVAWYSSNSSGKTHPVGTKSPNELGLFDMSGNVYEWCSDRYGDYSPDEQTNPVGSKSGAYRVVRGGSYFYYAQYCRAAFRTSPRPTNHDDNIGFRLALSLQ